MNRLSQYDQEPTALAGFAILVKPRPKRCRTRVDSLRCALRGLKEAWDTQPNLRIHGALGAGMVLLGIWCQISVVEWMWVSFALGLVIFAELMNTAIEETVDLVVGLRPDPLARRVKDVSAASVLVAAALAMIIWSLTFVRYFV